MAKPDFILIGAMKCATSTVCAYFERHPDTFMLPGQEPNFFSHDENWAGGIAAYEALFDAGADKKLRAEGSNLYTFGEMYPETAERMAQVLPDAKLMYVVRHPIKRLTSAWIQNRVDAGDDKVAASVDQAIDANPARLLDPSLYWKQIERFRAHYSDDQIWIGFVEDLMADPDTFFAAACAFLDIEPNTDDGASQLHQNPSASKRVPNAKYTAIRQSPLFKVAEATIPKPLRTWVKSKFLSDPAQQASTLSEAAHARLVETIRPDAERFLAYAGKSQDFWTFDQ